MLDIVALKLNVAVSTESERVVAELQFTFASTKMSPFWPAGLILLSVAMTTLFIASWFCRAILVMTDAPGGRVGPLHRVDVIVVGIEKQRARGTVRRAGIDVADEIELAVARSLDEPAVAAIRAAAGEDGAVEIRLVVRPEHDLAAVPALGRRSIDRGAGVDAHRRCRRNGVALERGALIVHQALCRLAAAPVAADHDLAAAGAAGGIDQRADELDVLAGHQDGAAGGAGFLPAADSVPETLTICAGRAGRLAGAGRGAEHDHAVLPADRVGLDHARGIDDGIDDRAARPPRSARPARHSP